MSSRTERIRSETDPVSLENPVLAFLKTYWDARRADRAMPARADIRPADLKEHLGWIVLLDVLPDLSEFRFRTVGTRVTRYFRFDATGKTVREAFESHGEDAVESVLRLCRKVVQERLPVRAFGGAGWLGQEFLDFDMLFVPLSDDGTTVDMILGAFTFDLSHFLRAHGEGGPPSA